MTFDLTKTNFCQDPDSADRPAPQEVWAITLAMMLTDWVSKYRCGETEKVLVLSSENINSVMRIFDCPLEGMASVFGARTESDARLRRFAGMKVRLADAVPLMF